MYETWTSYSVHHVRQTAAVGLTVAVAAAGVPVIAAVAERYLTRNDGAAIVNAIYQFSGIANGAGSAIGPGTVASGYYASPPAAPVVPVTDGFVFIRSLD